jgi:phytoene desaturase
MQQSGDGKRVIVIGAGVGGIAAALRLAKAGCRVTVIEQNERIGGTLNVWEPDVPGIGPFQFDTGPHVLTMPRAIRELFDDLGARMEDYLDLVRMAPICRYHFPDSPSFDAPADPVEAAQRISERFPGDEDGFQELLAYSRRVYDTTVKPFLHQDFALAVRGIPTPRQWGQLFRLIGLAPWHTLHDLSVQYLSHPELRQIFDLYAFYNGSSPYKASSLFAMMAWMQWGEGAYYLRGGLGTYADALWDLADDSGVVVRTEERVREILVDNNRYDGEPVVGVATEQGTYPADAVVCNSDPLTTYATLIPDLNRTHDHSLENLMEVEPSTSAFVMLLGVQGTPGRDFPHLAHVNSFLPASPEEEFAALFERSVPATDPVIVVTCPSVTEPEVAPPGYSTLCVMTSLPPLSSRFEWNIKNTEAYRDRILSLLETRGRMPGLRKRIVCEQIWMPETFQNRYGAWRGSLYGISSNGWRSVFRRPPIRAKEAALRGLYFVGGGTHPGGGLPLVTLSGKIAADAVLEDFARRRR